MLWIMQRWKPSSLRKYCKQFENGILTTLPAFIEIVSIKSILNFARIMCTDKNDCKQNIGDSKIGLGRNAADD